MNWGKIGRWVLLIGSVAIGVLAGMVGFWIFQAKVPAGMQTSLMTAETRAYYLGSGVGLGLLIFAWALLAGAISGRAAASQARRGVEARPAATPKSST